MRTEKNTAAIVPNRLPMSQDSNRLISDIYLDGAISEVATRRSEFAAILKSEGITGLIAALDRKSNVLIATTAGSF